MPTAVSYVIDNAGLVVRLDSAPSADPALAGSLCQKHADGLRVPRGWTIDDCRESVPRLFLAPDTNDTSNQGSVSTVKPVSAPTKHQGGKAARETNDSGLFDDDVARQAAPVESAPEGDDRPTPITASDERGAPWMPRLSRRGDEEDVEVDADGLPVRGRLLGRAFGDRSRGV